MSAQTEPTYQQLSAKDRIVIVMGPTGAGKSTFINYATQQDGASVGHTLQSQTPNIRAVRTTHPYDKGPVIFVDTPGFDDKNQSDVDIMSQIASWFVEFYKENIPISSIIYLHRISDNRMAGSPLKNLRMFASMCGQAGLSRVVLGTTMWGDIQPEIGARREQELRGTFWADMIDQGCTVHRFRDSYESTWKIVGILPTEQDNITISREIHDDKKRLNETAAGVRLQEELDKLISDQRDASRRLEEQVTEQGNRVQVEELRQRRVEIEKRISVVSLHIQTFKIPFGKRMRIFKLFNGQRARKD